MSPMKHSLTKEQVSRYSRQLLLQDFGVHGQEGVSSAKVLVVGAGGLGCPVSMYLAGAGVHTLGIVDYDEVTVDNLHRQIAHKEKSVGISKVNSLKQSILELNSSVNVVVHNVLLNRGCALTVVRPYDIVVDCTDNPATRYLVNDACVLLNKPLVSGSALRWEGQLTIYNYVDKTGERGPCYRCLFPIPPDPTHVTNCSEGGVLGPVVGVIGSMQALEVLKIAAKLEPSFSAKLYLFDGKSGKSRTISIRPRNKECAVCGDHPTITELVDYENFCGSRACDKVQSLRLLDQTDRISPSEYSNYRNSGQRAVLVDTRPPHEFAIASLEEAKNLTLDNLRQLDSNSICEELDLKGEDGVEVFVICHRGNDSQIAVQLLKEKLKPHRVRDVEGGYEAWASEVDKLFPHY